MKNKIISIIIIYLFLFTSLISTEAAAPSPRVDLDNYEISSTDKNNVYVSGTVTICAGQNIALFDSTGKIPLNYTTVKDTGSQSSFKIWVPATFLKEGTNTFKVISLPVRGKVNASMPKTVTVIITTPISKKDQVITANDISLKVNEKKNLNTKVSSNLPLTYVSQNPNIATVDANGTVYGNNVGSTSITITQAGNDKYNPTSKVITVTVTKKTTPPTQTSRKTQVLTCINSYQFFDVNKTHKLNAKVNTKLPLTYKSSNKKIVAVDSKGNITSKKPGIAKVTITQKGNKKYKPITKSVTVKVPNIKDRRAALQPWYDAVKKQADYTQGVHYGWPPTNHPTISNSKYYSTCITLPSVALQRLNLIPSGGYITAATDHTGAGKANCIYKSKVYAKSINSNYMTVKEVNGKVKTLINNGTILPGDILGLNWHTCIYYGKDKNGTHKFTDGGRIRKGDSATSTNHVAINWKNSTDDNSTVWLIARVNTFDVKTSCENGTITMSNKYMAGQTVKVTYKPVSGKKIKALYIDGNKVNYKKHKTSYTFKKLDKNHTVKVIFN